MLALGFAPNASQLRPVKLGNSLHELLIHNLAFENELVSLYDQASRYCARSGDHDSRTFFEALLNEERSHANELVTWLRELGYDGSAGRPSGGVTF
jgi:bacterioferritin